MTEHRFKLTVPGFVYYECLDPGCTEFPRENPDIPKPTGRRRGYGYQFVYDGLTAEQYGLIVDHVRTFGEAVSHGVDDTRPGRECLRWVERIEAAGPLGTYRVWLRQGDRCWWVPVTAESEEAARLALAPAQRNLITRLDRLEVEA